MMALASDYSYKQRLLYEASMLTIDGCASCLPMFLSIFHVSHSSTMAGVWGPSFSLSIKGVVAVVIFCVLVMRSLHHKCWRSCYLLQMLLVLLLHALNWLFEHLI